MARSSKKPVKALKVKSSPKLAASPKKATAPAPVERKKSVYQKILTAEGWKRLMMKKNPKTGKKG